MEKLKMKIALFAASIVLLLGAFFITKAQETIEPGDDDGYCVETLYFDVVYYCDPPEHNCGGPC